MVEYTTANEKVSIGCPEHGMFNQRAYAHLKGAGCPECGAAIRRVSMLQDTAWFLSRARELHGQTYDYSETVYRGSQRKLTIRCLVHGLFEQTGNSHLAGTGCKLCADLRKGFARKISLEKFLERANDMHGPGRYDYSKVVLERMIVKVTIVCPKHGEFEQTPHHHVMGTGCPTCREPRGEIEIRRTLRRLGIAFEEQWKHADLRNKRPLAFDFAVPAMRIAIEFDGEQHRRPVRWGKASEEKVHRDHQAVLIRDAIKNEWIRKNGWTLIRLSKVNQVEPALRQVFEGTDARCEAA